MSFDNWMTDNLEQVLRAGASLEAKVGLRMPSDWERLVSAAAAGGGILTITDVKMWTPETISRIAAAGPGHVVFKG